MTLDARPGAAPGFLSADAVAAMFAEGSIEAALGIEPTSVRPGRVAFRVALGAGRVRPHSLDPTLLGVLADCAAGISVFSVGSGDTAGVTAELRVDLVGRPAPQAAALVVQGTALRVGHGGGQGSVRIEDDRGFLVATATAIMARSTSPRPHPVGEPRPPLALPVSVLGPDVSGGDGPGGPVSVADVVPDPQLTNAYDALHGGVVLGLAQCHQERLLAASGRRDQHTSVTAEYLRPVAAAAMTAQTEVTRCSARFCSLRTEVLAADGTVLARVHGATTAADLDGPFADPCE
ncbi:acyl-CoA thioesterase domain-containing protein [Pseudonocardia sp. NPDC049154]|uniref:PaaI family thioesterase n=1 Tax=Pseudonocardia sp. NPDC049154 TaxID=3155501 RepID=UPI0033FEDA2E